MNKTVLIAIAAFLILVGGMYYFTRSSEESATVVDTSGWNTYTNTTYSYSLSYPDGLRLGYPGMAETVRIEETDDLMIDADLKPAIFGVTAYTVDTAHDSPAIKERNSLATLPLKEFAEGVRQLQVNDSNSSIQDKTVGELQEITFAGKPAYSFTLNKAFVSDSLGSGYILTPEDTNFNFIFVENKFGQKLMVRYLVNDTAAEGIKNSFKL